jgi:hypothetical protein
MLLVIDNLDLNPYKYERKNELNNQITIIID